VRAYAGSALRVVEENPSYAQPRLVNYDYTFRNILINPETYWIKTLIDWDDIHVMLFIVGVESLEEIKRLIAFGLAPDATYDREGGFMIFLPTSMTQS